MSQPEVFQLIFDVEPLPDAAEQTGVPMLGSKVLPNGSQIQYRHRSPIFAQAHRGSYHEGRLAPLPRGQHVAKFTP